MLSTLQVHERRHPLTSIDPVTLGRLPLFHQLTDQQLCWLHSVLHDKTCPAGTALVAADEPVEVAYMLIEGTAKVYVEQANGRNVILAILGPGQLIGEISLADNRACSATVVTLEESRLLWIDHEQFLRCQQTIPQINANIAWILAARLRLANIQIQSLTPLDASGRVARQILTFAREYGQSTINGDTCIPIRLTQDDLADLVGVSRVHINRVLACYKRRGTLSVDQRHHITVHNIADLANRCE